MATPNITLRPPTTTSLPQQSAFTPPTTDWLAGTWHVIHSTLPMWKSNRNVTITYNPLPPTTTVEPNNATNKLDDIVSYQGLGSDKVKTINGIDTASGGDAGAWDWRGKGWLKIASSHWEILGHGDLDGGNRWAVIYFAKTLFTPAGIDVFSRAKEGLEGKVVEAIKEALAGIEDPAVKKLAGEMFEVKKD